MPDHDRHFLVLVSFEGRIGELSQVRSVWVVPARELAPFLRTYQTRTVISRAAFGSRPHGDLRRLAKLPVRRAESPPHP